MAIEAPISKFKKDNFRISIGICLAVAVIFAYDGYLSKYEWSKRYNFYKDPVLDNDGKPDSCDERGWTHLWYNNGNNTSGCYNCCEVRKGQLWKKKKQ